METAATAEEKEASSWEAALRRMLPPGAPLPDEDHLDYSIALDLDSPPPSKRETPPETQQAFDPSPRAPRFSRFRLPDTRSSPRPSSAARSPGSDGGDASSREISVESNNGRSSTVKKGGACSRCGRSSGIFREKEACLVCDARFCSNCVLKAMGSMPEGRKCVGCIGRPIDERKRSALGRRSKMLSKLCTPLEVRQMMKAELECAANQLRPEQVVVNGRELRQEELDEILGCLAPPSGLRPGRYWYDKDSGLWGKVKTTVYLSSNYRICILKTLQLDR